MCARYFMQKRKTSKKHKKNKAFPGKPVIRIKFCQANKKNENATFFSPLSSSALAYSHFSTTVPMFFSFGSVFSSSFSLFLIIKIIWSQWLKIYIFIYFVCFEYYLMSHQQWTVSVHMCLWFFFVSVASRAAKHTGSCLVSVCRVVKRGKTHDSAHADDDIENETNTVFLYFCFCFLFFVSNECASERARDRRRKNRTYPKTYAPTITLQQTRDRASALAQ